MSVKLPLDCVAEYFPGFLNPQESTALFDSLCASFDFTPASIPMADGTRFENETGRVIFADEELASSGQMTALLGTLQPWPPLLRTLKEKIEASTQQRFHVCPCIYYPDGAAGADFHSDPSSYGDTNWIASISLGEEREFLLRSKTDPDDLHSTVLGHGSLIVMGPHCQERYEHAVPRDPKYTNPRINLTFRKFGWD